MIARDLPAVLADRVQLQQVLLNLILNACEAMQADRRARADCRSSSSRKRASHIRFSVRDSGTGIPASLSDHLFEPFVTTKKEGLGLGLSISRTIVAAHGGRMWAENNADGGATAALRVPGAEVRGCERRLTPGRTRIARGPPAISAAYGPMDTPRVSVAIVDDEESVRISLRRLCHALGLDATVFASGLELIDFLRRGGRGARLPVARRPHAGHDRASRFSTDS